MSNMKIKRLFVPVYKNVTVNLMLQADQITLLVGQNGMGKSNLLEVLLLIFDELYQLKTKGRNAEKLPFHYEMEYECSGRDFGITKITDKHNILEYSIRAGVPEVNHMIDIKDLELPNQIIGYYSGENKRIRTLVEKHIKSEERSKRIRYSKGNEERLRPRKLFFAENRHSMLVLTTLLLYKNHHVYGENIRKVLHDIVQVENWDSIHLRFRDPKFSRTSNRRKEGLTLAYYRDMFLQGENLEGNDIFWGIRGSVDKLLRLLLTYSIENGFNYDINTEKKGKREYFDIESIPDEEGFRNMLYERFPTPMSFLNALEECFVLNMVENFDITLHKEGERERYPYLNLSEGEQQYLTVMGLIAMSHSSRDETLFLLDEPDTHINPQWQRSYIEYIQKLCGSEGDRRSKAFFISTHSPLLVQAYKPQLVDMMLFKKDEDGRIKISMENYSIENWRIDQVLLSDYFALPTARSSELDEFMERRLKIIRGQGTQEDQDYVEARADRYGFLPTGETMDEIDALSYIHAEAKKLKEEKNEISR